MSFARAAHWLELKARYGISVLRQGTLLNQVMTMSFLFLVFYTFIKIFPDTTAFPEFVAMLVGVVIASKLIDIMALKIAIYLNQNVFVEGKTNARVFDDKKRLSKFKDQWWQLFLHTVSTTLEIMSLSNNPWLTDTKTLWTPCPTDQTIDPITRHAYLFVLAGYIFTGYQHRFTMVPKKDYYVMFGHHIATVSLILGSFLTKAHRVGLVIMFLHDASDVVTDLTQIFNHSNMEGGEYYYVTEIFFVVMYVSWIYTRLYVLPFKIIKSVVTEGHSLCALQHPGEPWLYPKCEGIPFFTAGVPLLCILVCMHAYWIYLFTLIFIKVLTAANSTSKGEVYEGD